MPETILVIPCYNEAADLAPERFEEFTRKADVDLFFVDDGSTDRTPDLLRELRNRLGGRAPCTRFRATAARPRRFARACFAPSSAARSSPAIGTPTW